LAGVPDDCLRLVFTEDKINGQRVLNYLFLQQGERAFAPTMKLVAGRVSDGGLPPAQAEASAGKPAPARITEVEKMAFYRSDEYVCRMARASVRGGRYEEALGFIEGAHDVLLRTRGGKELPADQLEFERTLVLFRDRVLIERGEEGFKDRDAFHQAVTISNTTRTIYGGGKRGLHAPPPAASEKMTKAKELAKQIGDPIERAAAQIAIAEDMVSLGLHEDALMLVRDEALFSAMEVGSKIKGAMFLRDIFNLAYSGRWKKESGLFFLKRVEKEMSACWKVPDYEAQMPDHISRWRDEDWAIGLAFLKKHIAEGGYEHVWQTARKFIKSADKIKEVSRQRKILYHIAEILAEIGKFNKAHELITQAFSL
jgi:hypothetical protein